MQNHNFAWLWEEWESQGRVMIPRTAFIERKIDLKQLLSAVPPASLSQMQRAIEAHGRRFQVSLDDDPGDQVDTVLRRARDYSKRAL